MNRIYMDNGATSWPKTDTCISLMTSFLKKDCSNVNRTYGESAEKDEDALLDLRIRLGAMFNHMDPETVILNSGITESINTVIHGFFSPEDHVITTSVEHNAVLRALGDNHIPYSMIPTTPTGRTDYGKMESVLRKNTRAMVVTAGSNVTGYIEDLGAFSEFARKHGLYLMVDTAQVAPFHEIDMKDLGIDALFFSGHKLFLGPEGTGGMILTREVASKCRPLISGGTGSYSDVLVMPEIMPDKFEAGTRNLPGLIGLYGSLQEIESNIDSMRSRYMENTRTLRESLRDLDKVILHGPGKGEDSTGVISISIRGKDPARVAEELKDRWNIEVRVGLHCASTAHIALGTYPQGTIRLTPGVFTGKDEIETVARAVQAIAEGR